MQIERFANHHDRVGFDCGNDALNHAEATTGKVMTPPAPSMSE